MQPTFTIASEFAVRVSLAVWLFTPMMASSSSHNQLETSSGNASICVRLYLESRGQAAVYCR